MLPYLCVGCISGISGSATPAAASKPCQSPLVVSGSMLVMLAWPRDGSGSGPPAHPASHRARPSRHDGAGRSGRSGSPAQQCLHTHLARARTQITLIHFKPTLSQEALQQILLKPYLHNVGRPITPSLDRGHLERVETLVSPDLRQ